MLKFIIIFSVVQIVNVILSTIKTILTTNGGKLTAAVSNAIYFAFYTFVLVYTADASVGETWIKAIITALTNLVGVYIAKLILEKLEKDRLWEIVATIDGPDAAKQAHQELNENSIANNYIELENGERIFHIYSKNREDSKKVKIVLSKYSAKYIVHEEKVRL